jgi:hypothetical protein
MPSLPLTIENLIDFYVDKFNSLVETAVGNEFIIRIYKTMTAEVSIVSKMFACVVVINRSGTTNISINKDVYQENYSLEFYIGVNTNEHDLKNVVQSVISYVQNKDFEMDLINNFTNCLGAIVTEWFIDTNYEESYRFHTARITINFFVIRT